MGQLGCRKSSEKQQSHKQLQKSTHRTSDPRKEQLECWYLGVVWIKKRLPARFKEKIHAVTGLGTALQPSIMELTALATYLSLDWPLSFLQVSWDPLWQHYQQMSLLILALPVSLDLFPSGLVLLMSFITDLKEFQWCAFSQYQQLNSVVHCTKITHK